MSIIFDIIDDELEGCSSVGFHYSDVCYMHDEYGVTRSETLSYLCTGRCFESELKMDRFFIGRVSPSNIKALKDINATMYEGLFICDQNIVGSTFLGIDPVQWRL